MKKIQQKNITDKTITAYDKYTTTTNSTSNPSYHYPHIVIDNFSKLTGVVSSYSGFFFTTNYVYPIHLYRDKEQKIPIKDILDVNIGQKYYIVNGFFSNIPCIQIVNIEFEEKNNIVLRGILNHSNKLIEFMYDYQKNSFSAPLSEVNKITEAAI